ncbi:hypothetical protein HKCCSP123_07535 [Rhodobacterales bacterium HKCCSP123]|nr:hypothetical protein [Rhodobacterales bacterium HKCCSP123]
MQQLQSYSEVDALRRLWIDRTGDGSERTSLSVLAELLREKGTAIPVSELSFAFRDTGPPDKTTDEDFRNHAIPVIGSDELRRRHAFGHLCDGGDRVSTRDLAHALARLGLEESQAEAISADLDRNGDEIVVEEDLLGYLAGHDSGKGYRATHVDRERVGREATSPQTPQAPQARRLTSHPEPARARTKPAHSTGAFSTVSPLDMQIGFFRLVQGAAYRSFRESYSAHSDTHLRARDLPYTVPDFAEFVAAAVEFHLCLGLVEDDAPRLEFRALARLVAEETERLEARIAGWPDQHVTPEMAAAEAAVAEARAAVVEHRRLLSDALEMVLVFRMHGLAPADFSRDLLTRHELNRLRHMELAEEHGHHHKSAPSTTAAWIDAWVPVLVSADSDRPDGAIMPVRFWYESFMPQLLRCASIRTDAELAAARTPDPEALAQWHREQVARGSFDRYAPDLRDGFTACTPEVQQALAQAWRLTEPYLNGLEKRREREQFGRETGALSQYVAFIDVCLGRSDVAEAGMRLSFPYYVGPAVWCYLHTAAELVEAIEDDAARATALDAFKRFFRAMASMYPCPYCRYHLNRYVAKNGELDVYPVEFMILGQRTDRTSFEITLEDRLDTIDASRPGSLRLFVWKLHNAVSSSIARTEQWYHREVEPLYTTRFWPGLDAELMRAHALGLDSLPLDRLECIYGVLKPAAHLAVYRQELQEAFAKADDARAAAIVARAAPDVAALDSAIETSGYLSRSYLFDPDKSGVSASYTREDEAFARSGLFIER